jgi:hypothetical protein
MRALDQGLVLRVWIAVETRRYDERIPVPNERDERQAFIIRQRMDRL